MASQLLNIGRTEADPLGVVKLLGMGVFVRAMQRARLVLMLASSTRLVRVKVETSERAARGARCRGRTRRPTAPVGCRG